MPVHTSDLKVRGSEIQKLIEIFGLSGNSKKNVQEGQQMISQSPACVSTGDAMKYLLNRVQSGNIPNERDALLQAMERKLEKIKKAEKG